MIIILANLFLITLRYFITWPKINFIDIGFFRIELEEYKEPAPPGQSLDKPEKPPVQQEEETKEQNNGEEKKKKKRRKNKKRKRNKNKKDNASPNRIKFYHNHNLEQLDQTVDTSASTQAEGPKKNGKNSKKKSFIVKSYKPIKFIEDHIISTIEKLSDVEFEK